MSLSCYSQSSKIKIENKVLKMKLEKYQEYIKQWAIKNHINTYLICIVEEKEKEFEHYYLGIITSKRDIDAFCPDHFAVIQNQPILLRTSIKSTEKNIELISFLKLNYWKEQDTSRIERETNSEKLDKIQEKPQDSVTVYGPNGAVRIARSRLEDVVIPTELYKNTPSPKNWCLKFKRSELIEEVVDKYEHLYQ